MKKVIVLLAICFFSAANYPSMAQYTKKPSPRMVDVGTIKEISKIIEQMSKVLQKILDSMEENTNMSEDYRREINGIMEKMSMNMSDLSSQLQNGQINNKVKRKLKSRIKSINKAADRLDK